jgi:hypothetical protein
MADAKISALTELASNPAVDDFIPILDTSTGSTKKISAANLAQRSLQGSVSNPQAVYAQRPHLHVSSTMGDDGDEDSYLESYNR